MKTFNALRINAGLLLGLAISVVGWAQTELNIVVDDGQLEIPIKRYAAFNQEAPILLWLPSSYGTSPKQAITASALGDIDIETWVVDLHLAYFIDEGRSSIQHFKAADIAELIQQAAEKTSKKVYLLGTDSGAIPVLEGIALAQQTAVQNATKLRVGGALLFHPALAFPTRIPGANARYQPIAQNSSIPIYYFQPEISTKQWHSDEIISTLRTGGSNIFFHPLPGVAAGFHLRPDDELTDKDLAKREVLPGLIKKAIGILSIQAAPSPPKAISAEPAPDKPQQRFGLKQLEAADAHALQLIDLQAKVTNIDYAQNNLSLISFWASWCEPCIKELPALARLNTDYAPKGLKIITINVGESSADIQKAIDTFKMSPYLNLRDPEGKTMKDWNVYGFPSNFLVDQAGILRYGSFGAVEWDEAENRQLIDSLLSNPN